MRSSQLVVTVTASREPLVRFGWLSPGAHLTAVGSDMPGKQEVEAGVLGSADLVVADHPPVAAVNGELQHALARGGAANAPRPDEIPHSEEEGDRPRQERKENGEKRDFGRAPG